MELEFHHVLRLVRRWWWLLIVLPMLTGMATRTLSARTVPTYTASTNIYIDPGRGLDGPDYNSVLGAEALLETYLELVRTPSVLEGVIRELGLAESPDQLRERITTSTVNNTLIVVISATDDDPQRAADVANAVARQFASYLSQRTIQRNQEIRAAIDRQIADVQRQLDDVNQQIDALMGGPAAESPETQATIDSLQALVEQLQRSYSSLLATSQSVSFDDATASTQVSIVAEARPPQTPDGPNVLLNTVLGVIAGMLIAGGIAALLQYVDTTVKGDSDIGALVGAPVLARVANVRRLRRGPGQLFILTRPLSAAAEAIRLLRTTTQYATSLRDVKILAIVSPGVNEGKSTITANLAIAMANAGLSTLIIDADLRHPLQHRIFMTTNDRGLATLLSDNTMDWLQVAVQVPAVPNLVLIPSGPPPLNPSDLLSSELLPRLLNQIKATVDVILIDTPGFLTVSDPLVVALNVDGVVLVARSSRTRAHALQATAFGLRRANISIVGVVLNRQSGRGPVGSHPQGNRRRQDEAAVRLVDPAPLRSHSPKAGRPSGATQQLDG